MGFKQSCKLQILEQSPEGCGWAETERQCWGASSILEPPARGRGGAWGGGWRRDLQGQHRSQKYGAGGQTPGRRRAGGGTGSQAVMVAVL